VGRGARVSAGRVVEGGRRGPGRTADVLEPGARARHADLYQPGMWVSPRVRQSAAAEAGHRRDRRRARGGMGGRRRWWWLLGRRGAIWGRGSERGGVDSARARECAVL